MAKDRSDRLIQMSCRMLHVGKLVFEVSFQVDQVSHTLRLLEVPSGYVNIANWKMTIEIVDLPIQNMVDLSSSLCEFTRG